MGAYLTIGMNTEFSLYKKDGFSIEQIENGLKKVTGFIPEIYDLEETNDYFAWSLNEKFLEENLSVFLKVLYPQLHPNNSNAYQEVLDALQENSIKDFFKFVKEDENSFVYFQPYPFGYYQTIYLESKTGIHDFQLSYYGFILAMAGKILMESHGNMFNLFTENLRYRFANFKLGHTLTVEIM